MANRRSIQLMISANITNLIFKPKQFGGTPSKLRNCLNFPFLHFRGIQLYVEFNTNFTLFGTHRILSFDLEIDQNDSDEIDLFALLAE
jgi:hypothetical protein